MYWCIFDLMTRWCGGACLNWKVSSEECRNNSLFYLNLSNCLRIMCPVVSPKQLRWSGQHWEITCSYLPFSTLPGHHQVIFYSVPPKTPAGHIPRLLPTCAAPAGLLLLLATISLHSSEHLPPLTSAEHLRFPVLFHVSPTHLCKQKERCLPNKSMLLDWNAELASSSPYVYDNNVSFYQMKHSFDLDAGPLIRIGSWGWVQTCWNCCKVGAPGMESQTKKKSFRVR
jgi:hypothetical protein